MVTKITTWMEFSNFGVSAEIDVIQKICRIKNVPKGTKRFKIERKKHRKHILKKN